jgi:hypothetical protein
MASHSSVRNYRNALIQNLSRYRSSYQSLKQIIKIITPQTLASEIASIIQKRDMVASEIASEVVLTQLVSNVSNLPGYDYRYSDRDSDRDSDSDDCAECNNYDFGYNDDDYEYQDCELDIEVCDPIYDTRGYEKRRQVDRKKWIREINKTSVTGLKISDSRMTPIISIGYADRVSSVPLVYRPDLSKCACGIKSHSLPRNKRIVKGKSKGKDKGKSKHPECLHRCAKVCNRIIRRAGINMMIDDFKKYEDVHTYIVISDTEETEDSEDSI